MPRTIVIAHHLVLTGYAHWLPNDPRGSGSTEIRQHDLEALGDIHKGRKRIQPPREELRSFYRRANPKLAHEPLWFDEKMRESIASAFATVMKEFSYTVWACAILRNHAHLLIRRHRDHYKTIHCAFADAARELFCATSEAPRDHPVWSDRPYDVFLYTPDEVRSRIDYIRHNPAKEGLPPQNWSFVQEYNHWPLHQKTPRPRKR